MSLRLIKHFFAITGGQLLNLVGQILLAPLFLRHWSLAVYGTWIVLSTMTSTLGNLDLGMNSAVGNRLLASHTRKDLDDYRRCQHSATVFYLVLAVGASLLLGLGLWLVPVNSWFGVKRSAVPDAPWILWLLALQVLWMMPVGLLGNFYATVGDPARSKWINNWRSAGVLLITVLGLITGCGMRTLALLQLVPMVPVVICVLWDIRRRYPELLPGVSHSDKTVTRELLRPSLMFAVIAVSFSLMQQGSVTVTSSLFGVVAAVVFTTARTLTSMAIQTVRIIGTTAWPDMTILYAKGDIARLRMLNRLVVTSSATLCIAIAAALWFQGLSVLSVWMPKVHVNLWFLRLLLIYIVLQAPWIANTNVTAAINRHHNQAWSYLASGVASIGSMLLLAPALGLNAIPLSLILGELLACYHFVVKDTCTVLGEAYAPYAVRLWLGLAVTFGSALGAGWLAQHVVWGPPVLQWAEVGAATLTASCLAARFVWISPDERALLRQKLALVRLRLRGPRVQPAA